MFILSLNHFLKNIAGHILAAVLIAIQLLLIVVVSNLFLEEYQKYSVFSFLKGKNGNYVQLLASFVNEISDDDLYNVLSENVELVYAHQSPGENYFEADGKKYMVNLYGNDKIFQLPYIYSGEAYDTVQVPEGCVSVNISDNCDIVNVGDTIRISVPDDRNLGTYKEVSLYIAGKFDFWSTMAGNKGTFIYDDISYQSLFFEPDAASQGSQISYNYELYVIGDLSAFREAGVDMNGDAKLFLLYPDDIPESVMEADLEALEQFVYSDEYRSGIISAVSIDDFFQASRSALFRKFGRYIPMLTAGIAVSLISFVSMAFMNGQKNKNNYAVMRMLGYKKKNFLCIGFMNSVLIMFSSVMLSVLFSWFLLYKGIVLHSFLQIRGIQLLWCGLMLFMILIIYTFVPLTEFRSVSVAEAIRQSETEG